MQSGSITQWATAVALIGSILAVSKALYEWTILRRKQAHEAEQLRQADAIWREQTQSGLARAQEDIVDHERRLILHGERIAHLEPR